MKIQIMQSNRFSFSTYDLESTYVTTAHHHQGRLRNNVKDKKHLLHNFYRIICSRNKTNTSLTHKIILFFFEPYIREMLHLKLLLKSYR